MIIKLDISNIDTISKILDIQKKSYKVEADIIGFYDIPTLKDTINTIKESNEIFYGYYIDNELSGIISYKILSQTLDIHRLAINPKFFRKGIANKLISFIQEYNSDINKIIVSTGKDNKPAIELYIKNGFVKLKDLKINDSLIISCFEKKIL